MKRLFTLLLVFMAFSCTRKGSNNTLELMISQDQLKQKASEFVPFALNADLSLLTDREKEMLPLLFKAATIMENIFWLQAFGDRESLLSRTNDPDLIKLLKIN